MAREIGEIQKQCGLKEPVEDFVEQVSKFYILVELLVLLVLKCNVNHRIQILDSLSVLFFHAHPSFVLDWRRWCLSGQRVLLSVIFAI